MHCRASLTSGMLTWTKAGCEGDDASVEKMMLALEVTVEGLEAVAEGGVGEPLEESEFNTDVNTAWCCCCCC